MYATQELRDEHDGILNMLSVLEQIAYHLETGKAVNQNHLDQILTYLTAFADQCHHKKEEALLYPALLRAGMPGANGAITVLLSEHTRGRTILSDIDGSLSCLHTGDREARSIFATAALNYVELQREHITKENSVLYVVADQRLTRDEHRWLAEGFARIEQQRIGENEVEHFQTMLRKLSDIYLL